MKTAIVTIVRYFGCHHCPGLSPLSLARMRQKPSEVFFFSYGRTFGLSHARPRDNGDSMTRDPLRYWNAPDEIAGLYPVIKDWRREVSWCRSRRHHHFETTYIRVLGGYVQTSRVTIHERVIRDPSISDWIGKQLDRSMLPDHPKQSGDVIALRRSPLLPVADHYARGARC